MKDHITKAYIHIDKPLGGARPYLKEYWISVAADLVMIFIEQDLITKGDKSAFNHV
jgi:hypothetical protein